MSISLNIAFLIRLHTVYCWFHAAVAGLSYSAHLQSIMPKSSSTWIFNKKDSKPVHQSGDNDFILHRANVCRSVQWNGTTNLKDDSFPGISSVDTEVQIGSCPVKTSMPCMFHSGKAHFFHLLYLNHSPIEILEYIATY